MARSGPEVHLVIGEGEIGTSLYEVLHKARWSAGGVYVRDVAPVVIPEPQIHVLHIAYPYSETFSQTVLDYIEQYDPNLTIIYSTTPIGTCEKIGKNVVHSPVEGRHPDLAESIRRMPRWVGCEDPIAQEYAIAIWMSIVPTVRALHSSAHTEMLKLRSTSKYGVNLVWADYEKKLADLVGVEWEAVKAFDRDYNYLYDSMGYPDYQRYILDPPNGEIGGHCVVPNAELLDKQFPNPMLKMIKKFKKKEK